MLFVPVIVNSTPVKAFVDCGAQMTILSEKCAKRCNLMGLLDTRYAGKALGVGTAKILGRVHLSDMKIGNIKLPCSFSII